MAESPDNIYVNMVQFKEKPKRTTQQQVQSGAGDNNKSPYRYAAVILGLLCLLLLLGLLTLLVLLTKGNSERKMEAATFRDSYNNMTRERNDFQTDLNDRKKELEQLNKRLTDVTNERNNLQNRNPWVYFNGSLYYISSKQKKTWQESRNYCRQRGADLVVINSKEEQDFLSRLKRVLWIGLTDTESEGTWKWVDGSQLDTSYWASGEPNGNQNENCADIKRYNQDYKWNDESCNIQIYWICEKTATQRPN